MTAPTLTEARVSSTRRKARAVALQALYEMDGARHDPFQSLEHRLQEEAPPSPTERFARKLVEGTIEHREKINTIISTYAPAWPIDQMATVDRNILRVAIYEMLMDDETPNKVAINEAVELAKVFGSESSSKFVNGVLGSVMESDELKRES